MRSDRAEMKLVAVDVMGNGQILHILEVKHRILCKIDCGVCPRGVNNALGLSDWKDGVAMN